MEILLVIPKYHSSIPFFRYELPIGLAYISAVLKLAGHQVDVLNLNNYYGSLRLNDWTTLEMLIAHSMEGKQYQVVMSGGISIFFDVIQRIFAAARKVSPDIISIAGGGLISSEPQVVMREIGVNIGVIGEGEETIVELMAELEGAQKLADVRGIIYWEASHKLIQTPPRPPIADIGALPFPDYDALGIDIYLDRQLPYDTVGFFKRDNPRIMPILASRSCPFKCSFCFHPVGNKYRLRSMDSVFSEIDHLIERYRVNTLHLLDELFGFKKEYFAEFCRRIKDYDLDFLVQLHVSQANEESIRLLKEAGCVFIGYGVESASNEVLKSMKKHSTVEQIDRAMSLTYEAGIQVNGNLIFGEKAETAETAQESFDWWLNNLRYYVNLSVIVPYPGSELWNLAVERGIITDKMEFIRNDCARLWRLNITRMSDTDYDHVFSTLCYLDHFYRIPAKVLSCRQQGMSPFKGRLYSLSIECPHCGQVVEYRNMHCRVGTDAPFLKVRLGCPKCNHRFDILPFHVEEGLTKLLNEHPDARFAILRENEACLNLLRFSPAIRERVTCVVDDLALYTQQELEGCPVIPLSNNIRQIAQMADVMLVISDPAHHLHISYMQQVLGPDGLTTELAKNGVRLMSLNQLLSLTDLKSEQACITYIRKACDKAEHALAAGSTEEAFSIYLFVLQKFPAMANVHSRLGEVALILGERAIAIDAFYTANTLAPDDVSVLVRLGIAFLGMGRHTKAKEQFEKALAIQPDHWEAFFSLATSTLNTNAPQAIMELVQSHLSHLNLFDPHVRASILDIHGAIGQRIAQHPAAAPVLVKTMALLAHALLDVHRADQISESQS